MKTPSDKIEAIVTALNAYSGTEAPGVVRATLAGMDAASIGVLHGITGVFVHAVKTKMPAKWLAQIHGDLLDAFTCLANIAHDERAARNGQLKVVATSGHRNGICGRGFSVSLFTDTDGSRKVCFDFGPESGCYGVLDVEKLAAGDIAFGSNSWRGDQYVDAVRAQADKMQPCIDTVAIAQAKGRN